MAIRKGEPFGVYTGGWIDRTTKIFKDVYDIITGGWFESTALDIYIDPAPQEIIYEAGDNVVYIDVEFIDPVAQEIIYETANNLIEVEHSNDYLRYPALPNKWFTKCNSSYDRERELIKVTQMEAYNMWGAPVYFYKTSYDTNYNKIWGEDRDRYVIQYWPEVMAYFTFPREDKLWTKFGIEGMENLTLFVSKEHFEYKTSGYIPRMGDLLQTEYNSNVYEIVEVKEESGMYLLAKQYTWEIIVRPFKDEMLVLSGDTSASPLSAFSNLPSDLDIFDIKSNIDTEIQKGEIIYVPEPEEKPSNDPWGNY